MIIFIVLALVIIGAVAAPKIMNLIVDSKPAEDISFSEMFEAFSTNANTAEETYSGKKCTFYFKVININADGYCDGVLCDSNFELWPYYIHGVLWYPLTPEEIKNGKQFIIRNSNSNYSKIDVKFSDGSKLENNKIYKIEGTTLFQFYDADRGDYFAFPEIVNCKIIEEYIPE